MKELDNEKLKLNLWRSFEEVNDPDYIVYIRNLVNKINESEDMDTIVKTIVNSYEEDAINDLNKCIADLYLLIDDKDEFVFHAVFNGININNHYMKKSFIKYGLRNTIANDDYAESLVNKDIVAVNIPDMDNELVRLVNDNGNLYGVTKKHRLVYGKAYIGYLLLYVIDKDKTLRYMGQYSDHVYNTVNLDSKEECIIKCISEDDMDYEGIYTISRLVDKKVSSLPFGLISQYFKDSIQFEMYINSLVNVNSKKLSKVNM